VIPAPGEVWFSRLATKLLLVLRVTEGRVVYIFFVEGQCAAHSISMDGWLRQCEPKGWFRPVGVCGAVKDATVPYACKVAEFYLSGAEDKVDQRARHLHIRRSLAAVDAEYTSQIPPSKATEFLLALAKPAKGGGGDNFVDTGNEAA